MFTLSQPSADELEDRYNRLYYSLETSPEDESKPNSDKEKFRQHLVFLNDAIPLEGRSILDYGCGFGNFLEVAREFRPGKLSGIELNTNARQTAVDKGFSVSEDLAALGSEKFDVIYMNDVIEHLRDPVADLAALRDRLTDSGMIFVVTMNILGLKARLLRDKWELITDPTHFYFYTPKSLMKTLHEAGFVDVEPVRLFVSFSHHGSLRSLGQRLLIGLGLDTGLKMIARSKPR